LCPNNTGTGSGTIEKGRKEKLMLEVTETATAHLARRLVKAGASEDTVVRLVIVERGFQTFQDRVRPGDVTFSHKGRPVLAIKKNVSELLGGKTLDVKGTGDEAGLAMS